MPGSPEPSAGPSQSPSTKPPAAPQPSATDQPAVAKPEQPSVQIQVPAPAQGGAQQTGEPGKGPPSPPPPKVETVTVSAGQAGKVKNLEELPALPRAGLKLALVVGGLISVVTLLVLIQWWRTAPWMGVPPGFSGLDAEQAKKLADNLKALSDASLDRSLKLFDDIVGRVLLPVFTSILGYIFGTRGGDSSTPPAK